MTTTRRKTVPLDDLRIVTNRTILAAKTVAEREIASHVWLTISLNFDNAYRGFMYVDSTGDAIPTAVIHSGKGYDGSRRFYF